MTKKIFRSVFLVSIMVLLLSTALIFGVLYEHTTNVSRRQLRTELKLAAHGLETEGMAYLEGLSADNLRITWIEQDGTVRFDNTADSVSMENHLAREEVQQAIQSGYGESERYSSTVLERLLYAAQRLNDGSILRLAITQNSIWSIMLGMLQPLAIVLLLSIILSVFLSTRMSRRIVKPLNNLDLDHPLDNEGFDELSPLFRRLATQQNALAIQEDHLDQQQEELDTILGNMQEGMILLRADNTILSMNDAVDRILHMTGHHVDENLLEVVRNLELADLVEDAHKGNAGERILSFYGRDYQVSVTPVIEAKVRTTGSAQVKGMTIVFFDVTEEEKAEQIRREFTANVSHELKTPLHSISGYAELLAGNMVKPKDVQPFAQKIYKESQRTIQMVEDIISLSHLDEGAQEVGWEETDVNELASETVERLRTEADKKHVTLRYSGEKSVMIAKPALISEIVANLCDNAIKYNNEGGTVDVQVHVQHILHMPGQEDTLPMSMSHRAGRVGTRQVPATRPAAARIACSRPAQYVVLTVSDNGIGIPAKDQERIFERFYRVDKSHSREIGGTGLGLSIVKHAVAIHHGTIQLQSASGQGTIFTITLPVSQAE